MDVTALDGRAYAKFVVAGTYFLKKYRGILNDLNVFPVPDGDTGTNMYLTVRSAALQAGRERSTKLSDVAAAAAEGSLMGARGNSGVIISQMLRGFAHHVRHRPWIDTFILGTGMREAVAAARAALLKPVEGTIISVAHAAAEAAYTAALHDRDFYRVANVSLKAAAEALERTPDQLPALKEAGVVDSGGAGFVYFLEAILRFVPENKLRSTAFPRRPIRQHVFRASQVVGENKYCTEFIVEDATCEIATLRDALAGKGDSLIVAGAPPTLKVHIHTDKPDAVQAIGARYGRLARQKVDNMEQQHNVLVVDTPNKPFSILACVPGLGFERITKELGAEVTLVSRGNPSVRELLLGINKCLCPVVYVLCNDANAVLAAKEVCKMTDKRVEVIPTLDMAQGIAALMALRNYEEPPERHVVEQAALQTRGAMVFFAGKDASIGGTFVARGKPAAALDGKLFAGASLLDVTAQAAQTMGARDGGLITLYYGGHQTERDAQRMSDDLAAAFPKCEVEYYFGGQRAEEFVVSFEQ